MYNNNHHSLPICMFENRTLVNLLWFEWVVQAQTKVLSGIPPGSPGSSSAEPYEHKHLFNRSTPGASACTFASQIPSGAVKQKLETHKHIHNRRSTGASHLRTWHAFKRVTWALACPTKVHLKRFSSWKSSIKPSFSSFKDLEETWSSIRGGLGLCSIFMEINLCLYHFLRVISLSRTS